MNLIYVMKSKVFVGNILWTIFLLSTSCESGTMNISEETTTAIIITTSTTSTSPTTTVPVRTPPKPSQETLVMCQCGSGEVINSTGQCQPLVGGTTVPVESKDQGPHLESTTDFKVVINEPACQYNQLDLKDGQFMLRRRGDLLVFKGDRRGFRVAEYCIQHKLVEGKVEVTARGCVPQPVIPRCCAQGEHMNNGECVTNPKIGKPFNPYLATAPFDDTGLAGVTFPWDDHQESIKKPTCAPGNINKPVELDGHKAYLAVVPKIVLLIKLSVKGQRQFIIPHQYCVDVLDNNDTYHAYSCEWNPEVYCKDKLCTIKCCPEGHALSFATKKCVPNDTTFNPPFLNTSISLETRSTLYGWPTCSPMTNIGHFTLLHNGSLLHRNNTYPLSKFCTDNIIMGDSVDTGGLACTKNIQETTWQLVRKKLFPVSVALSCVALVLLIFLHAWIPKLREKEGKYQLFHAASLLLAYSATLAVQLLLPKGYIRGEICMTLAFVMQFGFLSAFFWLNTMCFDVWRLFRNLVRSMYSAHSTVATWKYVLYALGGPLTITVITIIVQYVGPTDGSVPGLVHPHIGEGRCWFKSNTAVLAYHYGPVGVLYLLNFIFIGTTYYYLKVIRGDYKSKNDDPSGYTINSGETTRKYDFFAAFWQRFLLLVVLATCWLTEILSWLIPPEELWAATDILNNLQGLFVFFVFLAHHNKRALLKEKLPKLFKFSDICINHARTAQTYINNSNKKLSKKISSSTILSNVSSFSSICKINISTSSFNLSKNELSINTPSNGIISLSLTRKVSKPSDPNISRGTPLSEINKNHI